MLFSLSQFSLPGPDDALPGRSEAMPISAIHHVNGHNMKPPFDKGLQLAQFAMGCFWGAERIFWEMSGVYATAVGYAAGYTPNPTYKEVCSGLTAHTEVVQVVYDPLQLAYQALLSTFWESHNPTQGMRQGNDQGSQYRSGIYTCTEQQLAQAIASRDSYQASLSAANFAQITTEIKPATEFYYAEEYHQQYLAKNPAGYCGLAGSGINYKEA